MIPLLRAGLPLAEGERPIAYEQYHYASLEAGDVDPSYSMLQYLSNRFELNMEQRYWLAFLYATCYCGPTVYYIYNEFPDFENVNEARLEKWWKENRHRLYFQSDRRWIRSRNQWCDVFRSYKKRVGGMSQAQMFNSFSTGSRYLNYQNAWDQMSGVYQFGRFAMFLYLEAVHVVTGFPMAPTSMDLKDAESCRNGLAMAIGRPDLNTHDGERKLNAYEAAFLQREFDKLVARMTTEDPRRNTVWNIETTLCAYKKYCIGKRWVGYYLERQADEIRKMSDAVPAGVHWDVLWQYRRETFRHEFLKEIKS